jgi:hypothetical protein
MTMVAIENTRADLASFERKSTGTAWSPPGLALPFEPICAVDGAFYWLTRLLSAKRLRCSDFLSMIGEAEDGARHSVRAPSRERLDVLCEQTTVATCGLALRILGATPREADRAAAALGRGLRFTGILNDLAKDAVAHRLYLPRELL